MLRKSAILSAVTTLSLAITSAASAMRYPEPAYSSSADAQGSSSVFPWGDVAMAVAAALAVAACVAVALYATRSRRRVAALHS